MQFGTGCENAVQDIFFAQPTFIVYNLHPFYTYNDMFEPHAN